MRRTVAPYDRKAAAYDAIVGRPVYHRVFWGTSTQSFGRFGRAALEAAGDGPFAEVGCGSAPMYREVRARSVALVDRSMGMLRRGRRRLGSAEYPARQDSQQKRTKRARQTSRIATATAATTRSTSAWVL